MLTFQKNLYKTKYYKELKQASSHQLAQKTATKV